MNEARRFFSPILICLILGFLLSTAFYAQQRTRERVGPRKTELIEVIKSLEKERENLKRETGKLRERLRAYEKEAAAHEGILGSFTKELEELKFAAGLTAVMGPGVEVTLGDALQVPPGEDPNDYIIHDYDLRIVVNALWDGGAEAIAINNQRLVSTSAIRCAGNTILVNSMRLATPYKIRAIGNSERLYRALQENKDASKLLWDYAKSFGLIAEIKTLSHIKIPAYSGSLRVEHARAIKGED
ncbi:MAG: DUF881 domain-containing protein [Actinomycetota bacterium]